MYGHCSLSKDLPLQTKIRAMVAKITSKSQSTAKMVEEQEDPEFVEPRVENDNTVEIDIQIHGSAKSPDESERIGKAACAFKLLGALVIVIVVYGMLGLIIAENSKASGTFFVYFQLVYK